MSLQREDEATVAMFVADALTHCEVFGSGWEARGLDLGEVEIDVPNGQRFRLIVEEITEEEA